MAAVSRSAPVLWGQVCGLATVQGAISLAWVIYNLYLGKLLTDLGFAPGLATGLLILENILAVAMEPLMGSFSDRMQQRIGTRFPLISLGVILSAGCFLVLPTVVFWGQGPLLRWLLPTLLVAWALAMTVFRSPALSLLGRYAIGSQLPQAASVLTLVGGLAAAMGPLANQFILGLGPMVAFTLGSGVLLLATAALRWAGPNASVTTAQEAGGAGGAGDIEAGEVDTVAEAGLPWGNLALIFGAGAAITLGFRLVLGLLPRVLTDQVPTANPAWVMGALFLSLAATALPAGRLGRRLGNRRAMVLGLATMVLVAIAMAAIHSMALGLGLAIAFGAAYSLVANGTLPFALTMVPPHRAGLGTGLFFGGGALAASVFGLVFNPLPGVGWSSLWGALAFLLAGICVTSTTRQSVPLASAPMAEQDTPEAG